MPWTEQLPSGNYRGLYVLPDGRRRSAGTFPHKKRALAEATVAEEKAKALGWRDPQAAARSWAEWCDEWWPTRPVSAGTLKRDVSPRDKYLLPHWGKTALVDITRNDVKVWAAILARGGLSPASVQRYVHLFSASLTAALDAEILLANPAYRLVLPSGETDVVRYLTTEEQGRLLDATDDPLVPLLLGTGLRWGEGAGLHGRRVNLESGMIRVAEVWDNATKMMLPYPKGRKIRNVPLPDWVRDDIEPLIAKRGSGMIFGGLDIDNWRKRVWWAATTEAGLTGARIHDLRHSYASNLLQAGRSLAEVGKLLGHESPETTQRYAHLADISREHILTALPDPRGAGVGKVISATVSTTRQ